jgi:hypothetical protein
VLSLTGSKTEEVAGGKSITGFRGKMGTLFEAKTKDCDFGPCQGGALLEANRPFAGRRLLPQLSRWNFQLLRSVKRSGQTNSYVDAKAWAFGE